MSSKHVLVVLHASALLVLNIIGYWLGTEWNLWTHDRHPSAAGIPLVTGLSVLGFLCWYHIANALTANQAQLLSFRSWRRFTYSL